MPVRRVLWVSSARLTLCRHVNKLYIRVNIEIGLLTLIHFYSLSLNTKYMSGNIYMNFMYVTLVELPAILILIPLAKLMSRRLLLGSYQCIRSPNSLDI